MSVKYNETEAQLEAGTWQDWQASALRMLALREHSQQELVQKLLRKGMAPLAAAERLVAQLIADGLQSDQRYCESLVRSYSQKGMGPRRIQVTLQQHGIDSAMAARYLAQVDWPKVLQSCWVKKFQAQLPSNPREYGRQQRFLLQRGFLPEEIHRLLRT